MTISEGIHMKKINILNLLLFMLVFCFLATACEKSDKTQVMTEETTVIHQTTISTTETATTTEITTTTTNTTITATDTITIETTENAEKSADKQLVKAILMEYHEYYTEEQAEEKADWMVDEAEPYSPAGSIHSEKEAIEKARAILIADMRQDYIDSIERDFTIYEGQEIKVERDYPPYNVTYYEKYDAWLVFTHPLSGKLVDKPVILATPGTFPYVILRGNDGKILGIS